MNYFVTLGSLRECKKRIAVSGAPERGIRTGSQSIRCGSTIGFLLLVFERKIPEKARPMMYWSYFYTGCII